jgi:transcriptional regulator with XRE-family HTH domain
MKSPKQTRKDLGLKLEELQEKHNIAPSYISQVENGKTIPHKENRQRIEEVYGTKINWLDVPLSVRDMETEWYEVERDFRGLIHMINGLPEDEKGIFIETAIKQLRTVFKKY